jgi:hypothetical protein
MLRLLLYSEGRVLLLVCYAPLLLNYASLVLLVVGYAPPARLLMLLHALHFDLLRNQRVFAVGPPIAPSHSASFKP